jgi:translocation and assembly module TamA
LRPARPARIRPAVALAAAIWAVPAAAQEVRLTVAGDADLVPALNAASLLVALPAGEDTLPQDVVAAARADYRRLLTALYGEGYYGGTISITLDGREAAGLQPLDAPQRIGRVEIAVDPGPRFSFGTLGLGPLAPGTVLPPGFAQGAPARANLVQEAVRSAILAWRDLGHAKAEPSGQEIRAIHADNRLDVAVTLDPGPRLSFGALAVQGNARVRTERIVAIAGLREGEVFSPEALAAVARRLRRTGAFASVSLAEADRIGPGNTLPITVTVEELPLRRIGFGAEVSSTEGLSLSAFWLHRNLLGGAERLRLGADITGIEGQSGGPDYALTLSLARPATPAPDTDLTFNAALSRLDEDDYLLTRATADAGLLRYVGTDLVLSGGIGLVTAREETAVRTRDYTLVTLPLSATLDRRNDPFDTTSGYFIDADLTPFLGVVGGGTGGRFHADLRYYTSFGANDRLTLAARGQIGSVFGADLLDAPPDFLFYSGGGGTVRGQPYRSLAVSLTRDFGMGPVDRRVGGASFVGAQIEGRLRITDTIGAVGFIDWGMIDAEPFPTAAAQSHAGAGFGLRYRTGIGPIRLDIATPVTGDEALGRVEFYIGIGQAF